MSRTTPRLCIKCQGGYLRTTTTPKYPNNETFSRLSCENCNESFVELHILLDTAATREFRNGYGRARAVTLEVKSPGIDHAPLRVEVALGRALGMEKESPF